MGSLGLPFAPAAALFAALAAAGSAATGQSTGSIFVSTLPAGADVWIDGTYVGRSPALAGALSAGKHSVTLTKTGWAVRELIVEVTSGATAVSAVELAPTAERAGASRPTGSYVLRGLPKGAKVLVDGLAPAGGALSPASLSAGTHQVVMLAPGGRTTRTFQVVPDTTTEVVLHAPAAAESPSVVAPASAYLPPGVCDVEGRKIVVRYRGHVVVARFGESDVRFDGALVSYAGTPQSIDGKLYLPLELLERLRSQSKSEPDPARTR